MSHLSASQPRGSKCCFASPGAQELLTVHGLVDLSAALTLGQPVAERHQRRAQRHAHKQVVCLPIESAGGSDFLYIKRQTRRTRLVPRWTDLRRGVGLWSSPMCEWRGLHLLRSAGFDAAEPLGLFWSGRGWSQAAIVTRAVPPRLSLTDMILEGVITSFTAEERTSLVDAVWRVIAQLSNARLAWRSMKPKHFYPQPLGNRSWKMWLIDCEGVHARASSRDLHRCRENFFASLDSTQAGLDITLDFHG